MAYPAIGDRVRGAGTPWFTAAWERPGVSPYTFDTLSELAQGLALCDLRRQISSRLAPR